MKKTETKTAGKETAGKIAEIAKNVLGIHTLKTRNSDKLDFKELAVWSIENALAQAYEAGREAMAKEEGLAQARDNDLAFRGAFKDNENCDDETADIVYELAWDCVKQAFKERELRKISTFLLSKSGRLLAEAIHPAPLSDDALRARLLAELSGFRRDYQQIARG